MRSPKTEDEVPFEFNPDAMVRVLHLAASVADNDADKRDVLTVADSIDAAMEPHGGVHCKHPIIGDVDSARALVEGIMRLIDEAAEPDKHAWDLAKASKRVD